MSKGNTSFQLLAGAQQLLALGTPDPTRKEGESRADWVARLEAQDAEWFAAVDEWLGEADGKLQAIHAVLQTSKGRQDQFKTMADMYGAARRREELLQARLKDLALELMRDYRELQSQEAGFDSWHDVQQSVMDAAHQVAAVEQAGPLPDELKAAKRDLRAADKVRKQVAKQHLKDGLSCRVQANAPSKKVIVTDPRAVPRALVREVVVDRAQALKWLEAGEVAGIKLEESRGEHVRWATS